MENKTGIGRLLAKIGNFFEGLFSAAAKTYSEQSPEIQAALKNGSEILDIINRNIEVAPDSVILLIEQATGVNKDELLIGLNKVAWGLNITDAILAPTLEETISTMQNYLESKKGETWAGISALGAKLIAWVLAPKGTKWDVFESLMVYVYQKFVKK